MYVHIYIVTSMYNQICYEKSFVQIWGRLSSSVHFWENCRAASDPNRKYDSEWVNERQLSGEEKEKKKKNDLKIVMDCIE